MSTQIETWKQRDNFSTARHQELVDAINSGQFSGAGDAEVFRTPAGSVISVAEQRKFQGIGVRVKVTAAEAGGGKYTGKIQRPPTTPPALTGDLSAADLGSDDLTCLVVNQKEKGKSTHDLTQTPVVVDTFFGILYTIAFDGRPVVAIDGIDLADCTIPPTAVIAPTEGGGVGLGGIDALNDFTLAQSAASGGQQASQPEG